MAALVCDICGGKLSMGTGGIAVCDSCGMEHTKERMQEKVQEIKGTVRVDNSHMVDNWMKLGNAASQAGNNKEAYDYFTKVIEVDSENWRAIYEKGKAGAWQSTLGDLRTAEIYQGISTALEIINRLNLSEDEVTGIKNEFAVALFNINNAITDLMDQNLSNLDDKYFDSHWDQMWNTRQRYLINVEQLEDAVSLISDLDDDLSKSNIIEFKKRMCSDLKNACDSIQYWTDYSESALNYLGFSVAEKQQHLKKFWELVEEIRNVEPDFATEKCSLPDPFAPGFHMSEEIYKYWEKEEDKRAEKKKEEEQKKRFKDYWESHVEEKHSFEAEQNLILQQINQLNEDINKIPGADKKKVLQESISKLNSGKSSLGLFKSKEKKALQEQIDSLSIDLKLVETEMRKAKNELEDKIKPLQNRISEIKNELTKAR